MAKQIFIHTRLSRAYLALARLSCTGYDSNLSKDNVIKATTQQQPTWESNPHYPNCKYTTHYMMCHTSISQS